MPRDLLVAIVVVATAFTGGAIALWAIRNDRNAVVASSSKSVTVPDTRGMNLFSADYRLHKAGLNVSLVKVESTRPADGKIVAQDPAPGVSVHEGTVVKISVYVAPAR